MSDLRCPFCYESEFDDVGLKGHLLAGDCPEWNAIVAPVRLFSSAPAGGSPMPLTHWSKDPLIPYADCHCSTCEDARRGVFHPEWVGVTGSAPETPGE